MCIRDRHRQLRAAAVAVDPGSAGVAGGFSGITRSGIGICARHDCLPATVAARCDAGGVRRGVHVDHRDAVELGRELHRERFLSAIRAKEGG